MDRSRALAGACLLLALVAARGEALATPYALVSNQSTGTVLKVDAVTGEFLGVFASHPGITNTQNLAIGPDGLLYVADANTGVYRFNASTGAFVDLFIDASTAGLDAPVISATFGADQNLYVTSNTTVRRYDGTTGAFIDVFATSPTGEGVYYPLTFGPDGNLYAGTRFPHKIERFNGGTGSYIDLFIAPGPDGVFDPRQMLFHSDGLLYIVSENSSEIRRFDVDIFASGSALAEAHSIWFGPNGSLFATSRSNDHIFEFDGLTGDPIGVFATAPEMTSPTWAVFVPEPSTASLVLIGLLGLRRVGGELCVYEHVLQQQAPGVFQVGGLGQHGEHHRAELGDRGVTPVGHVRVSPAAARDVVVPHPGLELLGEQSALLSDRDVHEVAEKSAVLDRARQGGLGGLFPPTISNHLPQPFAQGLEASSEDVRASDDPDRAGHLQNVLLHDRLLPRLVAQALKQQIGDDAGLAQAERGA
jgi:outer membrane protein assembly factor BamB